MHILLIHQAFVTTGEAGGTRHAEIARLLAKKGHRVTVITSRISYLSGSAKDAQAGGIPGVEIRYAYTSQGMHKGFFKRLGAFFIFMFSSFFAAMKTKQVDVVWGTSPNLFQAFTAWLVARLKGKKFVLEIRDLWPEFAIGMGVLRNPLWISAARWLERFLYRHADWIVVNSPGFIPHIERISGKTPTLIANGSDVALFTSRDGGARFREEYALQGKFVVMYTGAHGPANDLDVVLDAAELLRQTPAIQFVLVGSGKEKVRLSALAEERYLANVTFVPPVPKETIADVMAAADAGLAILKAIPLFTTTYPNKVFDFMAAGKPVLCQIDGVVRAVVEANQCGVFVEPGNPRALADAVQALAAEPEGCRWMGAAGREAVREVYSRERSAEDFERLFAGLVQPEQK